MKIFKTKMSEISPFRRQFLFILFTLIFIFCFCLQARDLEASLRGISDTVRALGIILGGLSFLISGVCFYFSKRLGLERLQSAAIGTLIIALSSTIFSLIFNSFN